MLNVPTTAVARKPAYIYRCLFALATTNAPVATILEAGGVVCAKAYHIHRLTLERKNKIQKSWRRLDLNRCERRGKTLPGKISQSPLSSYSTGSRPRSIIIPKPSWTLSQLATEEVTKRQGFHGQVKKTSSVGDSDIVHHDWEEPEAAVSNFDANIVGYRNREKFAAMVK